MARRSLYQKFTVAYNNIAAAINIDAALNKFMEDMNANNIAMDYLGIRENEYWAASKFTVKSLATVFVYPILVPLFYICILPCHVIYHAAINTIEFLRSSCKNTNSSNKNNAHVDNQQSYTAWAYSKIPATPSVVTRGVNLIWSYIPSRPACFRVPADGTRNDLDNINSRPSTPPPSLG